MIPFEGGEQAKLSENDVLNNVNGTHGHFGLSFWLKNILHGKNIAAYIVVILILIIKLL